MAARARPGERGGPAAPASPGSGWPQGLAVRGRSGSAPAPGCGSTKEQGCRCQPRSARGAQGSYGSLERPPPCDPNPSSFPPRNGGTAGAAPEQSLASLDAVRGSPRRPAPRRASREAGGSRVSPRAEGAGAVERGSRCATGKDVLFLSQGCEQSQSQR